MQTMQVYTSELAKFSWEDKAQTVLVAGDGIVGIEIAELGDVDPKSLVGTGVNTDPVSFDKGSRWQFREERPLVESGNGGSFAFLVPAI